MRPRQGLAALLAAAGAYQIADWLRAGFVKVRQARAAVPALPPGAGEIRMEVEGARWTVVADVPAEPGKLVWLLLSHPHEQVSPALARPGAPLTFTLEAGGPGHYRFWLIPSGRRRETPKTLARKTARAVAAGEFHVSDSKS
ncbi:MAG: hypothetical protein FJZ01_23035 [Candidatus Sericytochromatia bacterium]|nr:hypothetical protein [Candidatus Tanganyikabacteria bacterium]